MIIIGIDDQGLRYYLYLAECRVFEMLLTFGIYPTNAVDIRHFGGIKKRAKLSLKKGLLTVYKLFFVMKTIESVVFIQKYFLNLIENVISI